MNGKGSRRRAGADDAAFKAAPWPPPSPVFRKLNSPHNITETCLDCGEPTRTYLADLNRWADELPTPHSCKTPHPNL